MNAAPQLPLQENAPVRAALKSVAHTGALIDTEQSGISLILVEVSSAPERLLPVLLAALVAGGCGSGRANAKRLSLSSTRSCLAGAGFRVVGGHVSKEASHGTGAVGELVIPGAFIAFYPSTMIADRAASGVRQNVARLRGSMVRQGNLTVAIVGKPLTTAQHRKLLDCLR